MSVTKVSSAMQDTTVGGVVQVVNVMSGAVVTGTTVLPQDDTIPQKTEGVEMMTLAITPTHASNKLIISATVFGSHSANNTGFAIALFQDATAGALAAVSEQMLSNYMHNLTLDHYMAAGTTSATTFKIRFGGDSAGTVTLNGRAAGRQYGGVGASSITITEIAV